MRQNSRTNLDAGEETAIALALQHNAAALLIDERLGRNVALSQGIYVIGVLGILIRAKQLGVIPALKPLLEQLRSEARFRLAPALVERACGLVGE